MARGDRYDDVRCDFGRRPEDPPKRIASLAVFNRTGPAGERVTVTELIPPVPTPPDRLIELSLPVKVSPNADLHAIERLVGGEVALWMPCVREGDLCLDPVSVPLLRVEVAEGDHWRAVFAVDARVVDASMSLILGNPLKLAFSA